MLILSASHQQRDRQSNALGHIFFRTSCSQCVFAICTLLKSLLAEFALNEHQLLHRLLLSSLFCNMLPCPHWIRPSPAPPWYSLALVQHRTSGAVQPWFSVPQHTTSLVQCYSSAPAWWCSLTNCNPLALSCTSLTHHCFSDFASISPPINSISIIRLVITQILLCQVLFWTPSLNPSPPFLSTQLFSRMGKSF